MTKKIRTVAKDGPNPIDVHVGSRVKAQRQKVSMSQSDLGDKVGLTFQQIQKYERGANRVGCSRLYEISKILKVPVTYFFDDMPISIKHEGAINRVDEDNLLTTPETTELVEAYYMIPDPKVRKRLFETVKTIAKSGMDE